MPNRTLDEVWKLLRESAAARTKAEKDVTKIKADLAAILKELRANAKAQKAAVRGASRPADLAASLKEVRAAATAEKAAAKNARRTAEEQKKNAAAAAAKRKRR